MIHPDSRSPWERIHAPESLKNKVLAAAQEARKAAEKAPQNRYLPGPKKRRFCARRWPRAARRRWFWAP